jgi:hypothetical protein
MKKKDDDRITCAKCIKKLRHGEYGYQDKNGKRYCSLKCLAEANGRAWVK